MKRVEVIKDLPLNRGNVLKKGTECNVSDEIYESNKSSFKLVKETKKTSKKTEE